MPLESATYINQLIASNPTSTDPIRQGDDHIRLIKAAIRATFPNLTGPVSATQAEINALSATGGNYVPTGGIIMWSGAIAAIPSGWVICDGTNGTPNLRDRFIVGAGTSYSVGATGGAATVALTESQMPAHAHSVSGTTSTDGSHSHTGSTSWADLQGRLASNSRGQFSGTENTGIVGQGYGSRVHGSGTALGDGMAYVNFNASHNHTLIINSAGSHAHSFSGTSNSVGSGLAHENLPPYYALAYIMKT